MCLANCTEPEFTALKLVVRPWARSLADQPFIDTDTAMVEHHVGLAVPIRVAIASVAHH